MNLTKKDMNLTYYVMSTRHLIAKVRKHLDFNSIRRSAIKNHILSCVIWSDVQHGLKSFAVTKKMSIRVSYQNTRSFIDQKRYTKLNRQFYAKRASFTSRVLNWSYVDVRKKIREILLNFLNRSNCVSTPFKLSF